MILNGIEALLIATRTRPGEFVLLKDNDTSKSTPRTRADISSQAGYNTQSFIWLFVREP